MHGYAESAIGSNMQKYTVYEILCAIKNHSMRHCGIEPEHCNDVEFAELALMKAIQRLADYDYFISLRQDVNEFQLHDAIIDVLSRATLYKKAVTKK